MVDLRPAEVVRGALVGVNRPGRLIYGRPISHSRDQRKEGVPSKGVERLERRESVGNRESAEKGKGRKDK